MKATLGLLVVEEQAMKARDYLDVTVVLIDHKGTVAPLRDICLLN